MLGGGHAAVPGSHNQWPKQIDIHLCHFKVFSFHQGKKMTSTFTEPQKIIIRFLKRFWLPKLLLGAFLVIFLFLGAARILIAKGNSKKNSPKKWDPKRHQAFHKIHQKVWEAYGKLRGSLEKSHVVLAPFSMVVQRISLTYPYLK